jgi:hypothetical protein
VAFLILAGNPPEDPPMILMDTETGQLALHRLDAATARALIASAIRGLAAAGLQIDRA